MGARPNLRDSLCSGGFRGSEGKRSCLPAHSRPCFEKKYHKSAGFPGEQFSGGRGCDRVCLFCGKEIPGLFYEKRGNETDENNAPAAIYPAGTLPDDLPGGLWNALQAAGIPGFQSHHRFCPGARRQHDCRLQSAVPGLCRRPHPQTRYGSAHGAGPGCHVPEHGHLRHGGDSGVHHLYHARRRHRPDPVQRLV